MKTWRGNADLPPSVDDNAIAWMTEMASTGKPTGPRPPKTRQYGDVDACLPPVENTDEEDGDES